MRPVQPNYRRRSLMTTLLGVGGAIVVGLLGLWLTLSLLGINLFKGREVAEPDDQRDPYLVRIPVNIKPIAAYERIARTDLIDPSTRWLRYQELPPESVIGMSIRGTDDSGAEVEGTVSGFEKADDTLVFTLETGTKIEHNKTREIGGTVMQVGSIIGRVLRKQKNPGLGFRADSLYPVGTPAGIAGATPPGMRGLVIEASKISGIHTLNAGDHIDLIANVPSKELASFGGRSSAISYRGDEGGNVTEPVMLAQNATILKPVYARTTGTDNSRTKPTLDVAIAIDAGDIIPVQSAMNRGIDIMCVARSMQPSPDSQDTVVTGGTTIQVPVTSRDIMAYEVVTIDHFQNPATRKIEYRSIEAARVNELSVLSTIRSIMGTVARHDIPKGCVVTGRDLRVAEASNEESNQGEASSDREARVPKKHQMFKLAAQPGPRVKPAPVEQRSAGDANFAGERPSITKFIPAGRKAVTIPWNRMYGAEHLQIGDRIDLLVSYAFEGTIDVRPGQTLDSWIVRKTERTRGSKEDEDDEFDGSNTVTFRQWNQTLGVRAEPWFAAIDAEVIGPVGYPPPTAASRFLGESLYSDSAPDGRSSGNGPPIVLAIDLKDLESVAAALASNGGQFMATFHADRKTDDPRFKKIALSTHDMPAGTVLTPSTLLQEHTRRPWLRQVPAGSTYYQAALTHEELDEFMGRRLKNPIAHQEIFTVSDFYPEGYEPPVEAIRQATRKPSIEAIIGSNRTVHQFPGLE